MNSFIAVLKDSFREAVDAKILYVMVGLSLLVVLLTGSLSFEAAKSESAIKGLVGPVVSVNAGLPGMREFNSSLQVDIKSIETLNPEKRADRSGYHFLLVVKDKGIAREKKEDKLAVNEENIKEEKKEVTKEEKKEEMPLELRGRVLQWSHVEGDENNKATLQQAAEFVREGMRDRCGFKGAEVTAKSGNAEEAIFQVETLPDAPPRFWLYDTRIFFGALPLFGERGLIGGPIPLQFTVYVLEELVFNTVGAWLLLLIGVIITAGFIPNMLRKGSIDLLLAKPMGRVTLLLFKYIGGLIFVLINTAVAVGGIWLVIGLRTGIWGSGFLLVGLLIVYFFAVLYAISTFTGVFTRSTVAVILLTIFSWFLFYAIGKINQVLEIEAKKNGRGTFSDVMKVLNSVTPRTKDLDRLTTSYIIGDLIDDSDRKMVKDLNEATAPPDLKEVMYVTLAWIAILLGLSSWRMSARDF